MLCASRQFCVPDQPQHPTGTSPYQDDLLTEIIYCIASYIFKTEIN